MYYYLEDYSTNAVIFVTSDVHVINNLMSGILDCHRFVVYDDETFKILNEHGSKISNDTGIKFLKGSIEEFSIDAFPDLKRKQELVKIRAPLFKLLLQHANRFAASNRYGFWYTDEFTIKYALSNPSMIEEYASIMNISADFAKQELTLIVDSILADNFRIFTVCNMWKERINKCNTYEDAEKLRVPIEQTFWLAGIPDVK
jgi:hypothetical protein